MSLSSPFLLVPEELPKSVTHVLGLFCYLCARSIQVSAADPGVRPTSNVKTLIRFCYHHAAVDRFTGDDALPAAVIFIDQRNIAHRGLEFLQPRIAGRIVVDMRHHEAAAALLGGD